MCGIVGYITSDTVSNNILRREWFTKALYVDALRGKHSTGMACIPHEGGDDVIIHKKAMAASDFLDLKTTQALLMDSVDFKCIIGHNRYATLGEINNTNAHPFQFDNITLVHNGTLDSFDGLDKDFNIDSEAICHALSIKSTKDVLETLDGAFSLVWHDSSNNTIHLARNSERPMHFGFSKGGTTMTFSSVPWMITELVDSYLDIGTVVGLKAGKHITIDTSKKDLSKYSVEDFTPKPIKSYDYKWDYYKNCTPKKTKASAYDAGEQESLLKEAGYSKGQVIKFWPTEHKVYSGSDLGILYGYTDQEYHSNIGVSDQVLSKGVHKNNVEYAGMAEAKVYGAVFLKGSVCLLVGVPAYIKESNGSENPIINAEGDEITEKEFNKLSKYGCAICSADVYPVDSQFIEWTNSGLPMCIECTDYINKEGDYAG